jgi:peroxisomal enoyl-CoA hydratase 2
VTAASSFRFPVEAGHVTTFARAIGDANPVYCDPGYARSRGFDDVLAPPTFYEAGAHFDPGNECRPHPGQPWFGSAGAPTGDPGREDRNPGTTLHAETHVTYGRHVCAGEVLDVRHRPGRRWTRVGRRGGDLAFEDWYVDYHDETGEVVLTARTVAVTTAQKLHPTTRPPSRPTDTSGSVSHGSSDPVRSTAAAASDDDVAETSAPHDVAPAGGGGDPAPGATEARPAELDDVGVADDAPVLRARAGEVEVGSTHAAVVVRDLRRVQIIQYAGASGDFSPQHTDEVYNTQVAGYPTVFAHGMLTMAMTGRMLTDWLGDGRLASFGLRFLAQVWPGDDLVARATVEAIDRRPPRPHVELSLVTVNQHGAPVVSGYATAHPDP